MSSKRNNIEHLAIIGAADISISVAFAQAELLAKSKPEVIVIENNQEVFKNESEEFKITNYDKNLIKPLSSLEIKDGKALRRERRKKDKNKK